MSTETNKQLVLREANEVFGQGRLEVYDEILAPDYVIHDAMAPAPIVGIEAGKAFVGGYLAAFRGMRVKVEDVLAEGDRVAVRWTASGRHEGPLGEIPASGNDVTVSGMSFYRIANGKIAEDWTVYDSLGLMQQIGAIPALSSQA